MSSYSITEQDIKNENWSASDQSDINLDGSANTTISKLSNMEMSGSSISFNYTDSGATAAAIDAAALSQELFVEGLQDVTAGANNAIASAVSRTMTASRSDLSQVVIQGAKYAAVIVVVGLLIKYRFK